MAIIRCLYGLLGEPNLAPLTWTEKANVTFTEIKAALGQTPALSLPNIEKPFNLFLQGGKNSACGNHPNCWALTMTGYISVKKLDSMATGWPLCLRVLASIVLLIKKTNKLTMGQKFNVKVSHAVVTLMNTQGTTSFPTLG